MVTVMLMLAATAWVSRPIVLAVLDVPATSCKETAVAGMADVVVDSSGVAVFGRAFPRLARKGGREHLFIHAAVAGSRRVRVHTRPRWLVFVVPLSVHLLFLSEYPPGV